MKRVLIFQDRVLLAGDLAPAVPGGDDRRAEGADHRGVRLRHDLHRHLHDVPHHQEPVRHQALPLLQHARGQAVPHCCGPHQWADFGGFCYSLGGGK